MHLKPFSSNLPATPDYIGSSQRFATRCNDHGFYGLLMGFDLIKHRQEIFKGHLNNISGLLAVTAAMETTHITL